MYPNDLIVKFAPLSKIGARALVPNLSKASKQRHQMMYDSLFAVLGSRLWNKIPSDFTQCDGLLEYCAKLKEVSKVSLVLTFTPGSHWD